MLTATPYPGLVRDGGGNGLHGSSGRFADRGPGRVDALVGLSVLHDGVALTQGLRLMLKPPSISSPEVLLRAARPKELPSHFEFVQRSNAEWVTSAWKVVAPSSSTIY